jgi:hypothetical protein
MEKIYTVLFRAEQVNDSFSPTRLICGCFYFLRVNSDKVKGKVTTVLIYVIKHYAMKVYGEAEI